jgi:hypothetical protein
MDLLDVAAVWSLLSVVTAAVVCTVLRGGHAEDVAGPAPAVPLAVDPVPPTALPQPRQPASSLQPL